MSRMYSVKAINIWENVLTDHGAHLTLVKKWLLKNSWFQPHVKIDMKLPTIWKGQVF